MEKYKSIDEIAKEYALTNEQLKDYLLSNNIDLLSDLDKINLNDKEIKEILEKINIYKELDNHLNTTSLKSIHIEGLFGKYDYSIDFNKDISIWVSENGAGKTTILNIIVAILTSDKNTLMSIEFKKITINISEKRYIIDKDKYSQFSGNDIEIEQLLDELLMYAPKYSFMKLRSDFERKQYIDLKYIEKLYSRYLDSNSEVYRNRYILKALEKLKEVLYKDLLRVLSEIKGALCEDILFYPTYRRVEVSLDKVFLDYGNKYNKNELSSKYIGFGMNDVKNRITNVLNKMRKDASTAYLEMNANIISELFKNNVSEYIKPYKAIEMRKVNTIIERIGEERIDNIDSLKSSLNELLKSSKKDKLMPNIEFLLYYLKKLEIIYDEQKPLDSKLKKFSDVCTKYLSGKKIEYNESLLTMNIYDCNNKEIDFEDLSSGEKQVISIFSKVYLDLVTPCIFIIDEPEISLSIQWQKEFLKDIFDSKKIGLMIATTHSPFIFKNNYRDFVTELDKYREV